MSTLIHFKRTLGDFNLEKIKQQAERSWSSSQTMPTVTVDILVTEIERLQSELEQVRSEVDSDIGYLELANEAETEIEQLRRDLHDERVRRDEWEKMYNQAIADTAQEGVT